MQHPLRIGFILSPKFTLLAFSAFVDTLRLAADEGDRSRPIDCSWTVLSHDMQPIQASCGVEIHPTAQLSDPAAIDFLVVVGGLLDSPPLHTELQHYIRHSATMGVALIGICTGSFVLAQLGLLYGFQACVSWFHVSEFKRRFPTIRTTSADLFTIDRQRITCAGGASVVHLAAHLISNRGGQTQAKKALRILIAQESLSFQNAQPLPLLGSNTSDQRVRKAVLMMERSLSSPLSTEFIAHQVHVSSRQLERLFKTELSMSPAQFALQLRLSRAHELLKQSRNPIADIAIQCGFVNQSHFSRSFKDSYGSAPSDIRRAS